MNMADFITMYYGLPTGDFMLVDRGFTCEEYAGMALAEVIFPPFTRGKKAVREGGC